MGRRKPNKPTNQTAGAASKPKTKSTAAARLSNADRSAFFGRREAANVLRMVLHGDARRRAVASIKSLVYSPSVRNKKATFALVCQTLKHLPVIKDVLETAAILNSKWKRQEELIYVITYDLLFGKESSSFGTAEKFLFQRKAALESALAKILVRLNVKRVEDLLAQYETHDISKPRYVRVNTLKLGVESAVNEFRKQYTVVKDEFVPDLLILPPGTDLHDHPLVMNGSVFLQGKASSMVAVALNPQPGWEVLDACSAPGNKTVHLAALMKGKGRIMACELNKDRVKLLQNTIRLAGATSILKLCDVAHMQPLALTDVEVQHGDFLNINPEDPAYLKLRAILLDPSCSGSGTAAERLDYLLPSSMSNQSGDADTTRLTRLAAFQKKALEHALSFPSVQRIVYSTCSIHQIENEDVIKSVLPMALRNGFQLASPFPLWPRRAEHLLRMDPVEDKEGFFIALFVREEGERPILPTNDAHESRTPKRHTQRRILPCTRISKMWLHSLMSSRRWRTPEEH
ncbi:hypothetical protein Cgig2_016288 [Carnegiea gigantea]|uniref:SAM-dependent MTase RsmB/NOP-type domain-containing protein n=1 Tax=Carnegiea gigantea TaxID=171969 RepID=A0A9Q1KGH8_9CARY|nr:hypothetical protein Cgig2_016288 [Carnegiea gigantea]